MSIEDIESLDSLESWSQSSEVSEKYKESAKKASAGIKRTQKDEGKAKKYDFLLARFLVELILKKKYDSLLEKLFICLDAGYGTNFLLWVLSLVYLPISHEIRKSSWEEYIEFHYIISQQRQSFQEDAIPERVRQRINEWILDMHSVISFEVSSLIMERTLRLVLYDERVRDFTRSVFIFFFDELNIEMSSKTAESYSEFILSELEKTLKKYMPDLMKDWTEEDEQL